MATPNLMQNLAENNNQYVQTGLQNKGLTPVGNGGGSTNPGPTGMSALAALPGAAPVIPSAGGMLPGSSPIQPAAATPGATPPGVIPPPTAAPTVTGGGGVAVSVPNNPVNAQGNTDFLTQLQNQYGMGIGATIAGTVGNLGSQNNTYMQAYEASVAQPNAENLATLNTTLGNEGVSGNSSTAAIANADFESGISASEGLQEQQLLQSETGEQVGLEESLGGVANKNQSDSALGDLGSVFTTIAGMF
jgi:hypothetical protein